MRSSVYRSNGVELNKVARERLRKLVYSEGEAEVRRLLELAPLTLARCLAGLPVQRRTAEHVDRHMANLYEPSAVQAVARAQEGALAA